VDIILSDVHVVEPYDLSPLNISYLSVPKSNTSLYSLFNEAQRPLAYCMSAVIAVAADLSLYMGSISFLRMNGVIVDDLGVCAIPVPIYKKCLYQTFKPLMNGNGEIRYFKDPFVDEAVFLDDNGHLDMERLLDRYAGYILERGNIIFSGEKAKEGVYHYNLDAYLASYASVFGGSVFPEAPEGGGRVDLLMIQGGKRWIVEVKRFLTVRGFEKGKMQLIQYLKRAGLSQGYYVVFSDLHDQQSKDRIMIDGLEIIWWILPVKTKNPSS